MNKRLYEIAGIKVEGGIRGEFITGALLAAGSMASAATPVAAGGLGAITPAAIAGGVGAGTAGLATGAFTGAGVAGGLGAMTANFAPAAWGASGAGGMGLFNAMNVAGMGMQALQAFSGGSTGGGAPMKSPPLSKPAKENQKQVRELEKRDLQEAQRGELDASLTSKYIRRFTQAQQGLSRAQLDAANITGVQSQEDRGTVKGVGSAAGTKAALAGSEGIGRESLAMQKDFAGMRREQMDEAIVNVKNLLREKFWLKNRETAATYQRQGLEQQQRARQGAALGQIASMGGLMAFMNNRGQ